MKNLKFIENGLIKFNYDFPIFNWFYPYNAEEPKESNLKKLIKEKPIKIFDYILEDSTDVALYFHIPFCQDICSFCPFTREILLDKNRLDNYVNALIREIELKKEYLDRKKVKVNSIFFGGGTPSILSEEQIIKLGTKINEAFNLSQLKEFSFEMNAKTITLEKAIALKKIGVTHVRVGVQTFNKKYRKAFCLSATLTQIENGIKILKSEFSNVSIDIMYGFNGETIADFLYDLKNALDLNVPNISLYPLNNKSIQERLIENYKKLGLSPCNGLDRLGFKIIAKKFMESNGYYPHNGHDFVKVKKVPENTFMTDEYMFEYHKTVYGKEKSQLISFGISAISFFNSFITMNEKSIDDYIFNIIEKGSCNMYIHSYNKVLDKNKPICLYLPYHGKVLKKDIDFNGIEETILEKLKILIEKGLVEETEDEFHLTESGWLSYVNILYYLTPIADQELLIKLIEISEEKRDIGLWNFEI